MAADPSLVHTGASAPERALDYGREPGTVAPDPQPAPLSSASGHRQWLVLREGFFWERGRYLELHPALKEATLGRSLSCHLRVNGESVSRIHAALVRRPHHGIYLMDLASRDGTFLNGERVEDHVLLMDGDRIRLGGRVELEFVDGPRPREPKSRGWIRRLGRVFC